MRLRVFATLLAAAAALAVVPVASPSQTATRKTVVKVSAKEFKFTLSRTKVPHGLVVFVVTNRGKLGHDFKIGTKKTPLLKPGKSSTIQVTLPKGGKKYLCTVAGHAAAGMKGTLRVT
jgi:plastocyanin